MTFTTDNRWSAGSLQEKVPETATAAYGARWIDQGSSVDVVPDRQGFAYNDVHDRAFLIERMEAEDLRRKATQIGYETPVGVVADMAATFQVWMRRAGGYVYVAAWIE